MNLRSPGPQAEGEAIPQANGPPVAVDDASTTAEDTAIGDSLSVTAVGTPSNGAAAITGNTTTVTYTPNSSFHGSDSFTCVGSAGNGGTDTPSPSPSLRWRTNLPTARLGSTRASTPSVLGTGQRPFNVDAETGQVTTAALLDYETQSQYSVLVRVRDGQGGSDVINVPSP